MPAYAIAQLRGLQYGPDIADYLRRIDATLAPYGGEFVVHGVRPHTLEGAWDGDIVIIGFPDSAAAFAWYESPAYRDILPLRTRHADCTTLIVEGVPPGYRAAGLADKLDRAA